MKIALHGPISSTDVWNVPISYKNHFEDLGHEVKLYNTLVNDKFDDKNLHAMISDYVSGFYVPDIVLHLDFGFFRSSLLKKESIPTAVWVVESGDDPQNFRLNFPNIKSGNFDLVLSPDIRCVGEYNKHKINAVWCPHFADPFLFKNLNCSILYDAVTTRSIEEPFFAELKNRLGNRFEARKAFLQGTLHSEHLLKGKMVIQNSKYKEITRRIFEGMLANRLVITDRPDPSTRIDLLFKENDDIIYFDTVDDCVEKINYFSQNEEERIKIAQNGFDKVSKNHTTKKRIQKILQLIQCNN